MGTSSGLNFFIDSHRIDGPRRSIFLDAIDVVRSPYNSDVVVIKQPPIPPKQPRRAFRRIFYVAGNPANLSLFCRSESRGAECR
jgi:hypothetical protein